MELFSIILFLASWTIFGVVVFGWLGAEHLVKYANMNGVCIDDIFARLAIAVGGPSSLVMLMIYNRTIRPPDRLAFCFVPMDEQDERIHNNFFVQRIISYLDVFGPMGDTELYAMYRKDYPHCVVNDIGFFRQCLRCYRNLELEVSPFSKHKSYWTIVSVSND